MDDVYNRFNYMKYLVWKDNIEGILSGDFQAPVMMNVYPSNKCPFDCTFCIMRQEKQKHPVKLSRRTLFKAVHDCIENEIKGIHFGGGGEPLTHPDILDAMELAHGNGVKVALSTNAYLIRDAGRLARNVDYLRISFNCATPAMHRRIHRAPEDAFERVVENIASVVNERTAGDIGLAFLILPENFTEIYSFCKLAKDLGVDFVHIRPAYLKDDAALRLILSEALALSARAQRDFADDLDIFCIKYKFDGYWSGRKYDKCRATPLSAVLGADGWFRICLDVLEPGIGDYNTMDFWDIWGSQRHKDILEEIDIDRCPRCVLNKANEIIENVFMKDALRLVLI